MSDELDTKTSGVILHDAWWRAFQHGTSIEADEAAAQAVIRDHEFRKKPFPTTEEVEEFIMKRTQLSSFVASAIAYEIHDLYSKAASPKNWHSPKEWNRMMDKRAEDIKQAKAISENAWTAALKREDSLKKEVEELKSKLEIPAPLGSSVTYAIQEALNKAEDENKLLKQDLDGACAKLDELKKTYASLYEMHAELRKKLERLLEESKELRNQNIKLKRCEATCHCGDSMSSHTSMCEHVPTPMTEPCPCEEKLEESQNKIQELEKELKEMLEKRGQTISKLLDLVTLMR